MHSALINKAIHKKPTAAKHDKKDVLSRRQNQPIHKIMIIKMVKIRVQWLSYGGMALSFSIKKYSLDWEKKVK